MMSVLLEFFNIRELFIGSVAIIEKGTFMSGLGPMRSSV